MKNQKGFTLVDQAVTVSIAVTILALSLNRVNNSFNLDSAVYDAADLQSNVTERYKRLPSFKDVSNASLEGLNLVPKAMMTASGAKNSFGGAVTFRSLALTGDTVEHEYLEIKYEDIPKRYCADFVKRLQDRYFRIEVASAFVKSQSFTYSDEAAVTACSAQSLSTITFTTVHQKLPCTYSVRGCI